MRDTIQWLEERRRNSLGGGVNCIPLPFARFRSQMSGVEQSKYYVVTAPTKAGKTQLASFIFVYSVLDYAYENSDRCRCHIMYFPLEETPQRIRERYLSHLLWQLDKMRLSPSDLRSTDPEYPVPQEAIDLLKEDRYCRRLDFFDSHVEFITDACSADGIRNRCVAYARTVGDELTHRVVQRGSGCEVEVFDSYTPYDENLYNIVIVDHASLIGTGRGERTKDAVDRLSENIVKYLRNRYGFTVVLVQQQAFESEGLEAVKLKRVKPSLSGLGDSKYTARDANMVLGVFSPSRFGLGQWMGYDVDRLKDNVRFMEILANRDGEVGGVCPLLFDGATCTFEELPPPDNSAMEGICKEAENRRSYRQQRRLLSL